MDRDTPMMLPPDLRDWVAKGDIVHFIIDAVELLVLREFKINRKGTGSRQYPPAMMLSLLIYNYVHRPSERRFDTPEGRSIYSKRMWTVEPVFGYLRGVLHLGRFTLRGKKKVNIQWLFYCIVYNIAKLQKYASIA